MDGVSVIIINYHTELLLEKCISSMLKFHANDPIEIIVVNNGGDLSSIQQKYSQAKIIEKGSNTGFSAANNSGLKYASFEYVLFLNSDIEFQEPVIMQCVEQFKLNSHIGVVGCKLLNADLSLQLSYHDGNKWLNKLIWRNSLIIKLGFGNKMATRSMDLVRLYHEKSHYVPWLSGAFMMTKKSEMEKIGSWDEVFFMYWEDVDLCYRYRKSGKRILYYNERSVVHLGGGGSDPSITRYKMMEDSKRSWLGKQGFCNVKIYTFLMKINLRLDKFLLGRRGIGIDKTMQVELEYYNLNK